MPKSKCPTKWKDALTKAEAEKRAKDLRAKPGGRYQHAYECPEGHWHVGSSKVKSHAHHMKRGTVKRSKANRRR